jgi:hypothetical protein
MTCEPKLTADRMAIGKALREAWLKLKEDMR